MLNFKLQPDEEIRSELIKLSLEQWHTVALRQREDEMRQIINHVVRSRQDVKNARIAHAIRHRLVTDPPACPTAPTLTTPKTSEDNKKIKEAWDEFYLLKASWRKEYREWLNLVIEATKNIPELAWRSDSYQTLRSIYCIESDATLCRDILKRMNRIKGANYKKQSDPVTLIWQNDAYVSTGEFYGDRRGVPYYNALVRIPVPRGSRPIFIKGRLRRPLPGKQIQGIILTRKPDGWYAAVQCIIPKRQLPEPKYLAIGVDVGQTDLVALSNGYTRYNPRDVTFMEKKATIQQNGDRSTDANFKQTCRRKVSRLGQTRKRQIVHWLNSELLPVLSEYSLIFIEKLSKGFKSDKGSLSCMHMILNAIKLRFGDVDLKREMGLKSAVREVNPAHTSKTCSCCGNRTEIVRKGKYFSCLATNCMATLDADVNAAKNILKSGFELLYSEPV